MKLWIDHTGLHATGRCLAGTQDSEIDISGFLQTASQIVFADTINFSGFENAGFNERSANIRELIVGCGLEATAIRYHVFEESTFAAACVAAATRFADDFQYSFSPSALVDQDALRLARPDMPPDEKVNIDHVHQIITCGLDQATKTDLISSALSQRSSGADVYMIASSHDLLRSLKAVAQQNSWTPMDTEATIVHMRYYLNQELAKLAKSDYAPAVARSRIMGKHVSLIFAQLKEVDRVLSAAVRELEPDILDIPSVANALVRRANGDPRGVIEEAVRARDKATDLRKYLASLRSSGFGGDSDELNKIRQAIRELGHVLQMDLDPTKRPRLRDAFEVQFLGLIPIPNFAKVIDWVEFKSKQKQVSILSEFAKSLADQRIDPFAFEKLRKKTSKNAS